MSTQPLNLQPLPRTCLELGVCQSKRPACMRCPSSGETRSIIGSGPLKGVVLDGPYSPPVGVLGAMVGYLLGQEP